MNAQTHDDNGERCAAQKDKRWIATLGYKLAMTAGGARVEMLTDDAPIPSLRGAKHRGNPYDNGTKDVRGKKSKG
jgi:hypothetical protein